MTYILCMLCLWCWTLMNSKIPASSGNAQRQYTLFPKICVCMLSFVVLLLFFCCCCFRAVPMAYGGSQARSWIEATAASLHHSHSNVGSKPYLWPTPQSTAMPDPSPTAQDQGWNLSPHRYYLCSLPLSHKGDTFACFLLNVVIKLNFFFLTVKKKNRFTIVTIFKCALHCGKCIQWLFGRSLKLFHLMTLKLWSH